MLLEPAGCLRVRFLPDWGWLLLTSALSRCGPAQPGVGSLLVADAASRESCGFLGGCLHVCSFGSPYWLGCRLLGGELAQNALYHYASVHSLSTCSAGQRRVESPWNVCVVHVFTSSLRTAAETKSRQRFWILAVCCWTYCGHICVQYQRPHFCALKWLRTHDTACNSSISRSTEIIDLLEMQPYLPNPFTKQIIRKL